MAVMKDEGVLEVNYSKNCAYLEVFHLQMWKGRTWEISDRPSQHFNFLGYPSPHFLIKDLVRLHIFKWNSPHEIYA